MSRLRLDQLLVARGLAESRAKAKAAIEAGGVTVDGASARAASQAVNEDAVVTYVDAFRWVGRGALKLERALDLWPVAVDGRVVLDVGASTGGFTEVCLDRGAARVFAVDVGTGQLHPKVAVDPRVLNLEKTDARDLTPDVITEAPSLIVCDVSFISLSKVLPTALDLAAPGADLITLVKPQFEADGPKAVGKKG
uniref:TlyA family RNA methyltransferase n=4 Tax=unclassified Brevundimonas TaxID=2622653 RepID=UPI0028A63397